MNNTLTRKLFVLSLLLSFSTALFAQAPAGYYKSAEGKNKQALLEALCDIIGPHTNVGYNGLWEVYETSDVYPGTNKIWDMYSTATFYAGKDQCGNYFGVGDCYNREHSFPKSWFNDASPMISDAYHIYPTDGKVNGQRSNYPYGECANGTYLQNGSNKGTGKLGKSTFPGYNGTVFEPADEYKGDFARTYFYMAACYNDKIKNWHSDMLAGNNYPCYTTWAVNLLMKWHRQDPVSQKEIDRNNAVYKYQENRNPFIDHPELAEFVWGDKNSQGWVPGGIVDPVITSPVNGKTFDLGVTAIGKTLSTTINVKAQGLNENLSVSISGTGFSITTTTITKDAAMASTGANITVNYTTATPATANGTLTISSSEVSTTVSLKAQAVDGIPALQATNVSTDSFTARWTDVDRDGSKYKLSVFLADGTTLLPGYPVEVAASAQQYNVTGLDYMATYKYSLSNTAGKTSNVITVTTAEPDRIIQANLPEGELVFFAEPNTASNVLPVEIYTEYIEEDINVTVSGEFQISSDKSNWTKQLTVDRDGERIYVRMPALAEGIYRGTLSASTETVEGFTLDIVGSVEAPRTFFEDFEAGEPSNNYSLTSYTGNACKWKFNNAGICNRSAGDKFNDNQGVCFGKNTDSSIQMDENKNNGAGTVTFFAAPYGNDEAATVVLSYSVDNGSKWIDLKTLTIEKSDMLKEYTVIAQILQPVRFRLQQKAGNRVNIDDFSISDYTSSVENVTTTSNWDAYICNGQVMVETQSPAEISIYTTDAKLVYNQTISTNTSISLPQGIYIVVNGNDSRKVIVK